MCLCPGESLSAHSSFGQVSRAPVLEVTWASRSPEGLSDVLITNTPTTYISLPSASPAPAVFHLYSDRMLNLKKYNMKTDLKPSITLQVNLTIAYIFELSEILVNLWCFSHFVSWTCLQSFSTHIKFILGSWCFTLCWRHF